MEPTINSDDILFTEHISALTQSIKKGDIIIAKCPSNPKQQICKRVIALQVSVAVNGNFLVIMERL